MLIPLHGPNGRRDRLRGSRLLRVRRRRDLRGGPRRSGDGGRRVRGIACGFDGPCSAAARLQLRETSDLTPGYGPVTAQAWRRDGATLLTADFDRIQRWDAPGARNLGAIAESGGLVVDLSLFEPASGKARLAVASRDGAVAVRDPGPMEARGALRPSPRHPARGQDIRAERGGTIRDPGPGRLAGRIPSRLGGLGRNRHGVGPRLRRRPSPLPGPPGSGPRRRLVSGRIPPGYRGGGPAGPGLGRGGRGPLRPAAPQLPAGPERRLEARRRVPVLRGRVDGPESPHGRYDPLADSLRSLADACAEFRRGLDFSRTDSTRFGRSHVRP